MVPLAVPVPLKAALDVAVPVIVISVVSARGAPDGVKINVMVQDAPAAKVAPQVVDERAQSMKSPVVIVYPRLDCIADPVLLMVTTTPDVGMPVTELGKFTGRGEMVMIGATDTPVPVSCAVPVALPFTLKVSVNVPAAPGVKTTLAVQLAAAARVAAQVLDGIV